METEDVLQTVELTLANAKRVERESRIVVRELARLRDELQADEATSSESATA